MALMDDITAPIRHADVEVVEARNVGHGRPLRSVFRSSSDRSSGEYQDDWSAGLGRVAALASGSCNRLNGHTGGRLTIGACGGVTV